ncbi:MAG TPA: FHA domain-containing protein [Myxococcales bacterium]|jgi:pSer/pThr/pTyr-binding forkhead associated (FHA) protein
MKLVIEGDEGRKSVVPVRDEMTIGRDEGNTVRLPDRNISRRHARLFQQNGKLLIEDLGSFNGVRVNGRKIEAATAVKEGDLIELGDYELSVEGKLPRPSDANETLPVAQPVSQPEPGSAADGPPKVALRDLDPAETPRLVGLSGPVRGKEFHLTRTEVKFGRGSENDLAVDHQSVSRAHARFVLDRGQWQVVDNQSANGIRINGDEYAVGNLSPGDTIELGHVKFRFCAAGEKFALPAETPPEPERPDEPETMGSEAPETTDARASSAVRVAALAVVLLTALAGASWIFGRRGHERARHGETAPFARAPAVAEPAPAEAHPPPAAVEKPSTNAQPNRRLAGNAQPGANASPAANGQPGTDASPPANSQPAASAPKPPAPEDHLAAPASREAKEAEATRLATASNEKLNAHDFEGAVKDAQAALDLAPEGRDTLCTAYHTLGYGFSYLNDNGSAKKYLEQFKPCCAKFGDTACAQVDEFLAR